MPPQHDEFSSAVGEIVIHPENLDISNCSQLLGEQYITNVRHDVCTIMGELMFG